MLCLRCTALPSALRPLSLAASMTRTTFLKQTAQVTSCSPLRTLSTSTLSAFRPQQPRSALSSLRAHLPSFQSSFAPAPQTRSFSASASLAGKRSTYNPSRRVQKRRHGFLARLRTRGGRIVLMRRRTKGRKALSW